MSIYQKGTRDYGDDGPIRLCRNYPTCGGVLSVNSATDLCHGCAQAARREAEADAALERKLANHRRAEVGRLAAIWWAQTEPQPVDALRSLAAQWEWEIRRGVRAIEEVA